MKTAASFMPKTSAKLTLGDYAMLKRDDGRYVPLVFLAPVPGKRVTFYGGLLALISSEATLSHAGSKVAVAEVAMIDIDAFPEANAPIVGNIRGRLDEGNIEKRVEETRTHSRVWGRRTPLKYANALAV
jgi:hypothetical protein